jgi:hypothetical protein
VAAFRLGFSRWRRAGIAGAHVFGEGDNGASATARATTARVRQGGRGGGDIQAWLLLTHPGHEIPNTEYRTESTENRTESTETEIFGTLFGSQFPGTEFTEVYSVLYLGLPNLPNLPKCVDFECCYVDDCTIVDYYIM